MEQYATNIDRVKDLCGRIFKALARDDASVIEARLAAEMFLNNMEYNDGRKVEDANMRITERKNKIVFTIIEN